MREERNVLPEIALPEIEFSADKTRIERGQSVALRWNVKEAKEATLWESTVLPSAPEPLDWMRISQLGEKVKSADEMELTPEETTAYYLVAKTPLGMSGRRIVVEVVVEEKPIPEPEIWEPEERFLERIEERSHVAWIEGPARPAPSVIAELAWRLAEQWVLLDGPGPGLPPLITISINPQVIFEDESAVLSWTIANANCATGGVGMQQTFMVAWAADYSGTKMDGGGWGAGGMPPCALPMSGSWNIASKPFGARHEWHSIWADNAMGKSAVASQ